MDKHYLHSLFNPERIVHITDPEGESEHLEGAGVRPDLALIRVDPSQIERALERAGRMQCRAAVILASGMDGAESHSIRSLALQYNLKLLGPNSAGFQRPHLGLNASSLEPLAAPGTLAFISQSGSLSAAVLDWALEHGVGFSAVVSIGPHSMIDLSDALDFLASDGQTQSIVVYMEGIQDARSFMSTLRSSASKKPVVVLKAGRGGDATQAALTHSQAMVGRDDVFDAALRRAGAVRVRSFVQLFSAVRCLAVRYRPVGKRLAVVTNGGGPGVMAADWIAQLDLTLGQFIDLSLKAGPTEYEAALLTLSTHADIDGILVLYTPQPQTDAVAIAQVVGRLSGDMGKPVLACWMGEASVRVARHALDQAAVPNFRTPEAAVESFHNIASFYENQQLLQQIPAPLTELAEPDLNGARMVIEGAWAEGRCTLTEVESTALLAAFHLPVTQAILARSAHEAMLASAQMGYPVALKIDSPDVLHKSDVQGVVLNVMNAAGVRDAFAHLMETVQRLRPSAHLNGVTVQKMVGSPISREVFVGLVTDETMGPILTFGAGGTMIELIQDRSMELPPLNRFLARRMMERSRIFPLLKRWRGEDSVDMESLERILLRVSEMVCVLPQIKAIDINPILVDSHGAIAVDARVILQTVPEGLREYGHLAIPPYPSRYVREWLMKDGAPVTVRPMHPDDAKMLQQLVQRISPESRYFRFASTMTELSPHMLARLALIDYEREMALVAVAHDAHRILAVSRYVTNSDRYSCEFSLLVDDAYAGQGLGSRMMKSIMEVAKDRGLREIDGLILANNTAMLRLMHKLGFSISTFEDDPDFKVASHTL